MPSYIRKNHHAMPHQLSRRQYNGLLYKDDMEMEVGLSLFCTSYWLKHVRLVAKGYAVFENKANFGR